MNAQNLLFWAALVSSAALLRPVQEQILARANQGPVIIDILYFGSPEVLKKLALGYGSLLADIYWMRSIQYYGRRDEAARRPVRYGNLAALLDITTTLDPKLLDAYRFGSSCLAEPEPIGAGQPHEAVKLLDKGIAFHPVEWRLHFDKGFIYFWFLNDYKKAGEVWLAASRLSTSPEWMSSLAAMALSRSGAVETARALWQRQLEESNREDVKANARNHLLSMRIDEERWTLEFFARKYQKKFGTLPARLEDLVRTGFLNYVPRDPSGIPYQYDAATGQVRLSPASKVRYIHMPYNYRDAFLEKLAREFGP